MGALAKEQVPDLRFQRRYTYLAREDILTLPEKYIFSEKLVYPLRKYLKILISKRLYFRYFKDNPILYTGPAKTPEGYPCGSISPTTPNRTDPYEDELHSQ